MVSRFPVVSRAEREEATRAWREVPHRTRQEVLRAAKRGERHPDAAALAAAQHLARVSFSPSGPRWYQTSNPRASGWIAAATAAFLVAAAVLLLTTVSPSDLVAWLILGVGVLIGLFSAYSLDFARETRHLLALDEVPGVRSRSPGPPRREP